MRLALQLHTWQIKSVIKPNTLRFMNTDGKEIVTAVKGSTKGTDCTINHVYQNLLPHKTELAEFKKELLPLLITVSA